MSQKQVRIALVVAALAFGFYCVAGVFPVFAGQKGKTARTAPKASIPRLQMEFVPIPKGEFMMGCSASDDQCLSSERPQHKVQITKGFELGKYEVTQDQWESVMGTNPSSFIGGSLPVDSVSWNDVQDFLAKLNARKDGYHYRLPTEAEWEYAARAGAADIDPITLLGSAWNRTDAGDETHAVGQLKPNAWGLYDMLGNVSEWVQDSFDETYYQKSSNTDPQGPESAGTAVLRGGSYGYAASSSRFSARGYAAPWTKSSNYGFRCVREPA